MPTMQSTVDKLKLKAPQLALERILHEKCNAAKIRIKKSEITKAAKHILSGRKEDFVFGDSCEDSHIEITDQDVTLLTNRLKHFFGVELPTIVDAAVEHAADGLYLSLWAGWPKEQIAQAKDIADFRRGLERRYGKPFAKLRMLLTIGREMVQESHLRRERDEVGELSLFDDVMLRLHSRACQVMMETLSLLENGFADGAMARWRTLHEISTVATLIQKHGPEMARRYAIHQNVESKKAIKVYEKCYEELGFKPFSKRLAAGVNKAYDKAMKECGAPFAKEYGWAAKDLARSENDHLTFERLELAAGMGEMRAAYKMASYGVHAGPKGVFVSLSQMHAGEHPVAGASNAGLIEPAQNSAVTFARLTLLLFGLRDDWTVDDRISADVIERLMFEIPQDLKKAHNKLKRDDRKLRKTRQETAAL